MLLIDEVDRSDDEFEAFLFELLAESAVTIPELGTRRAALPPVVVLTSNRTRDLHDALQAALPVPLDRLPGHQPGGGDHPPPGARPASIPLAARWPRASPGCATWTWPSRRAWPRPSAGRPRCRCSARSSSTSGSRAERRRGLKYAEDLQPAREAGFAAGRRRWRRPGPTVAARFSQCSPLPGCAACRSGLAGPSGSRPRSRWPPPGHCKSLYLCALATLVSSKEHGEVLAAVFGQVFGGLADPADRRGDQSAAQLASRNPRTPEDLLAQAARAARLHASGAPPDAPQLADGGRSTGEPEHGPRKSRTGTWAAALSAWPPRTSPICPTWSSCSWPP